jgi:N-acetylglucosaminyldiphosphoundecaprenol N-acetyl-beta-D-mannosaminyltransferase
MFTFLSVRFFNSSMDLLLANIKRRIQRKEHFYICVTDVHALVEAQINVAFQQILNNSEFTVPDGMPVVWAGRILGKKQTERIYGPDLMKRLCALAEKSHWKVFLYGTTELTLLTLVNSLKKQYPKLRIAGTYAPPFSPLNKNEAKTIYSKINLVNPTIIFVGLSTPKQERWIYDARAHLKANILIGVGAAFDFIAGTKHQAPHWVQKIGMEWLYRLIQEPHRLWKRYAVANTLFIYFIVRNLCRSAFLKLSIK